MEFNLRDNIIVECRAFSLSPDSTSVSLALKSMKILLFTTIIHDTSNKNITILIYVLLCFAERKKSETSDKWEEALIESLKENKESSPINGFLLRLHDSCKK